MSFSVAERQFIIDGVSANIRADGRGRLDSRDFNLETGVISQANGSARIVLDTTQILVGIKAELIEPTLEEPKMGRIQCSVDCAPSASQDFEGRGAEELNAELSQLLQKVLTQSGVVNLESLCVLPGVTCWILYIDALILDFGGNLADALLIAARSALFDLRIPNVTVKHAETGQPDIEVSDDPDDVQALDIKTVPLSITFSKVGERHFVVDATLQEEGCVDARLLVAVNKKGNICLVQKGGQGTIHPSSLAEMINTGKKLGSTLIAQVDAILSQQSNQTNKHGFLS